MNVAQWLRPAASSIRSRILVIALIPALLTEFGLVGYFTQRALTSTRDALEVRASNAARHLADALPYALVSGNVPLIQQRLKTESVHSQLARAHVSDAEGRTLTQVPISPTSRATLYRVKLPIYLPEAELQDGLLLPAPATPTLPLGWVEIGVSLDAMRVARTQTLWHAALLMLAALGVTGVLAWRLSSRFAGQLQHVGHVVGQLAHNELAVRTMLPATGEIGQLAAGINDMAQALQTHRGELEQRIRDATINLAAKKEQAERANQAKSRFFAAASHDLRQPLHALSLFVAALKACNQQAETTNLIDNIEAASSAMTLLLNALLDISRLDAGAIEARPQHFSLEPMLDELTARFAPIAAEKGVKLSHRSRHATLYSDPLLIERILDNLIANAIRYTDDGGVLIGCRQRGSQVRLTVWDTGRGIAPEHQENIFHEFVQLHNPARDRTQGLGLGLAIVSRLARLMGHRIDVRSRPGCGSAFSLDVPLGHARLIETPAASPPTVPGALATDALVVLIDDESAILRGMAELFEHWEIDLVVGRNAAEALHWLAALKRTPDVIVSDYRLPDDDGIAVIAQLRSTCGSQIPAVLVTGDTAPDTLRRIQAAELPLLHKPLRPAKLRALITHLIQQNRARMG
ncbi:MAG: hybrid sensor histidine kinase/response regulator [Thiobacillus sp.]